MTNSANLILDAGISGLHTEAGPLAEKTGTTMQEYPLSGRLSYLSAADFGANNGLYPSSTRAELGYDSPGRVTNSLGNSSRRFHESTFESATFLASASGSARNLSAHTGASAAITASSERSFAILSAVLPSDQPPQLKPITIVATAPAAAPCIRRFSDSPWRIEGTCMLLPFDKRDARRKQRAEARKPRILSRHPRGSQLYLELLLCLPTAPALPLKETGTSVCRRFLGSSRTSQRLPVFG